MTPCEQAFVDHFRKVCPSVNEFNGGTNHVTTDEQILETWHECFADWQAAVEWGQAHPTATTIASKVRRIKAEPTFLYSLNPTPWNERGRFGKGARAQAEKQRNEQEG